MKVLKLLCLVSENKKNYFFQLWRNGVVSNPKSGKLKKNDNYHLGGGGQIRVGRKKTNPVLTTWFKPVLTTWKNPILTTISGQN